MEISFLRPFHTRRAGLDPLGPGQISDRLWAMPVRISLGGLCIDLHNGLRDLTSEGIEFSKSPAPWEAATTGCGGLLGSASNITGDTMSPQVLRVIYYLG